MNVEQLTDIEGLWDKNATIGKVIQEHLGKEHQEHFYLLCQLFYTSVVMVPTLDRFIDTKLPHGPIKRIDLWRLGDRLLETFLECRHDLDEIGPFDSERLSETPPAS